MACKQKTEAAGEGQTCTSNTATGALPRRQSACAAYHGNHAADETKVLQVLRVDARVWVNLELVIVGSRILEEAVHGVEHLVRDEEKPLARNATIVQAFFAGEADVGCPLWDKREPRHMSRRGARKQNGVHKRKKKSQRFAQPCAHLSTAHLQLVAVAAVVGLDGHNGIKRILEELRPTHGDGKLSGKDGTIILLQAPVLMFELALVLGDVAHAARVGHCKAGVVKGGCPRIVVHKVLPPVWGHADLPASWQRQGARQVQGIIALLARVLPLCVTRGVVHKVCAALRRRAALPA